MCLDKGGRSFLKTSGHSDVKLARNTGCDHPVHMCVRVMLSYECMCSLGGTFWRTQLGCTFGGVPIFWANEKSLASQVEVRGFMNHSILIRVHANDSFAIIFSQIKPEQDVSKCAPWTTEEENSLTEAVSALCENGTRWVMLLSCVHICVC